VSGYLMRLAMRGRETSEVQCIQPFVRTTSPVAQHDQRIGMMRFAGFEFGEASVAEGGSEAAELEQDGVLQPPTLPGTTATSDIGAATVQRKMASPSATPVGPTTPAAPSSIDVDMPRKGELQPARQKAHRDAVPPSSRSVMGERPRQAPRSPLIYPEKNVVAGEGWSIFSTDATREHEPIPGGSQTRSPARQFGRKATVRTRSLQEARQVDSTRLEPSPRTLAEHFEPPIESTSTPTADAGEGPRIFIGRINVEVVSPPAAPQSTAAPRPGPLTAASVSVIGPLGGGIRPNLRLSLRHR
jgi:hypothetical protein